MLKWLFYNILFTLAYFIMLPRFLIRMRRRGGYRSGFLERFGYYTPTRLVAIKGPRPIWIHAVSVGEVAIAGQFMKAIRNLHPDTRFVLSVTTSTGRAMATRVIENVDSLIYFPVDFPPVVNRVCRLLNPRMLVLTETEIWPNLIRRLHRTGVPIAVVNGRLSDRAFRGYRYLRSFFTDIFRCISLFLVQSERDRDRILRLGVAPDRTAITGSVKYDQAPPDGASSDHARNLLRQAGIADEALILVGGSTWPGEEIALAEACRAARRQAPDLRLVLVPRHAERRGDIRAALIANGFRCSLRSALETPAAHTPDPDVLVVDSTGELIGFYALATLVFIGKSLFANHGGQNPIEAAAFGKPIITGPHMENFTDIIRDFRTAEAVLEVHDTRELTHAVQTLLTDSDQAGGMGCRARDLVLSQRGAIERSIEFLHSLLKATNSQGHLQAP